METLRRIVVVGAGLVGTTAALALARSLSPHQFCVTCIPTASDDADLGTPCAVVASSPGVRAFHAELGIDEAALVRSGIASFSLGTAFVGWLGDAGRPSFQPYGDIGVPVGGVPFHQLLARLAAAGHRHRSTDYSIAALMAQAGRFVHPADDPHSPLSSFTYGLHLHGKAYAAHLKQRAERAGAVFVTSAYAGQERGPAGVAAVRLSGGELVEGDIFIDASGPSAHLLTPLDTSWTANPGIDRLIAWERSDPAPPAPYDVVTCHSAGWQVTTPGPRSVGELFAYSSAYLGDEAALRKAANSGAPSSAAAVTVNSGRRHQLWSCNVIALGGAAAVMQPLGSAALDLAQDQVRKLLRLFPAGPAMEVERAEYNREAGDAVDRMQDYLQLRPALNGRAGERFWDDARNWPRTAALDHKTRVYGRRGRVPLLDGDGHSESEWAAALEAMGVSQQKYEALAEALPVPELQARLHRVRDIMIRAIAPLPRHGDYLAQQSKRIAA